MKSFNTFCEDAALNARQASEKQRMDAQHKRAKEALKRRHDNQDAQSKREN
tara:strand:- start:122 stop:274 length:153 start_codon:yes stop_codon:yes gene_type:complete